jgi:hypothetical protein
VSPVAKGFGSVLLISCDSGESSATADDEFTEWRVGSRREISQEETLMAHEAHHEEAAKHHHLAAEHHEKGDHKIAHEHAVKANEHSEKAHEHSTAAHAASTEAAHAHSN